MTLNICENLQTHFSYILSGMYSKGSKNADLFAAEYPDKTAKMEHFIICRDLTSLAGRGKCQPRCYPRFLPRFFMKYDPLLKILLSQPRRDFYLHLFTNRAGRELRCPKFSARGCSQTT